MLQRIELTTANDACTLMFQFNYSNQTHELTRFVLGKA
jgi:hypothetical protein